MQPAGRAATTAAGQCIAKCCGPVPVSAEQTVGRILHRCLCSARAGARRQSIAVCTGTCIRCQPSSLFTLETIKRRQCFRLPKIHPEEARRGTRHGMAGTGSEAGARRMKTYSFVPPAGSWPISVTGFPKTALREDILHFLPPMGLEREDIKCVPMRFMTRRLATLSFLVL